MNLGLSYNELNLYDEAIDAYQKALQLDPADIVAHYNLATTYFQRDHFLKAVEHYLFVLKLDPSHIPANYNLALVYEQIDLSKALQQWKNYVKVAEGVEGQENWVEQAKNKILAF